MQTTYNLNGPRYALDAPTPDGAGRPVHWETTSMEEAMFFLALGYTVHEYRWDGTCFTCYQNYYPGDL